MDLATVHWELIYPDGSAFIEPGERLSIKAAPRGARTLAIVGGAGVVLAVVELPAERPVPIVYRLRSIGLDSGTPTDDGFVFGHASRDGGAYSLWACASDDITPEQVRAHPHLVDEAAIRAIAEVLG